MVIMPLHVSSQQLFGVDIEEHSLLEVEHGVIDASGHIPFCPLGVVVVVVAGGVG